MCLMTCLTAGAQILDISNDNLVESSYHLSDLNNIEYVPAMNWDIQINDIEYYVDNSQQVHVTANITTGENADLAKVALSESTVYLSYEDFKENKIETVNVGKGTINKLDFVLKDPTKTYYIYAYTENNYWKNLYQDYLNYWKNENKDNYTAEDLESIYDLYRGYFYSFGYINVSDLVDYPSYLNGWSREVYLGEGIFTYTQMINGEFNQDVYCRTNLSDPNVVQYIIKDWFYGVDLIIDCDKTKTISGTNYIILSVAPQFSGYTNSSYGEVMVADSYYYWHDVRGNDVTFDKVPSYYDPATDTFVLNLAYYVSAGYFSYGEEYLTFGEGQKDYNLTIVNAGSFANENGEEGVNLSFTLGDDVQSVSYVIENQESPGSVISEGFITDDETVAVILDKTGKYTVTASTYDDYGNEQNPITFEFEFSSSREWKPKWVGDYTYTQFFCNYDSETGETTPFVVKGLVCEQNTEDSEQFRIPNWGFGTDFKFKFTAGGNVEVAYQSIGYEEEGYGPVYVTDLAAYVGSDKFGQSSYDENTGTFHFYVYYPIVGTNYSYGYGEETYQITDEAVKARVDTAYHVAQRRAPKHVSKPSVLKPQKLYLFKFKPNLRLIE